MPVTRLYSMLIVMADNPEARIEDFFSPEGPRILYENTEGWTTPLSYIRYGLLTQHSQKNFTRQIDRLSLWIDPTIEDLNNGTVSVGGRAFQAGSYLGYGIAYELLNIHQRNAMAGFFYNRLEEIIGPSDTRKSALLISTLTEQLGDFGWSLVEPIYGEFMENWGRRYARDEERYNYLKYGFGVTALSANAVLVAQNTQEEVQNLEEIFRAEPHHDDDPPTSPALDA